MVDGSRSVFISYSLDATPAHARAVFFYLRDHGYEVFLSPDQPESQPERELVHKLIAACGYVVIILTPGAVGSGEDVDDWLCQQIEAAIAAGRPLVPFLIGGFRLDEVAWALPENLAALGEFDAIESSPDDLTDALHALQNRFLVPDRAAPAVPLGMEENEAAAAIWAALERLGRPEPDDLAVESCFAQAYRLRRSGDLEGAIAVYSQVIDLTPENFKAFYNRGLAHYDNRSLGPAISDFSEAIRLKSDYVKAYYNRGLAHYDKQDYNAAIADLTETLRLDTTMAGAYNNRGLARRALNDLPAALDDFSAALRIDPQAASIYNNRARTRQAMGDVDAAITDYRRFLELGGGVLYHNQDEVEALIHALQVAQSTPRRAQPLRLLGVGSVVVLVILLVVVLLNGGAFVAATINAVALGLVAFMAVSLYQQPEPPQHEVLSRALGLGDRQTTLASPRLALTGPLHPRDARTALDAHGTRPGVDADSDSPDAAETQLAWGEDTLEVIVFDDDKLATRPVSHAENGAEQGETCMVSGQLSDVGMVRQNNQDSMFSLVSSSTTTYDLPPFGLFVVADGMGGHLDGEKASAITTQTVAQYVLTEIVMAVLKREMDSPDRPAIVDVLRAATQKANATVANTLSSAGTTATIAVVLGNMAYLAHVGDSRAYLIRDGQMEQITRDHSLVQRLIELEQLTKEQAAVHPQRNVLYRAIGQDEDIDIDTLTRRVPPGAHLLLCSDGLWGVVPEQQMAGIVEQAATPQAACNTLVELANAAGGPDNITVVLVRMPA